MNNKLLIAAAGSGKTTYLVNQAKAVDDSNVLIVTYTEANAESIKKKFKGSLPKNVTVQTWFSFLLQHGVRPYQGTMSDELDYKRIGFFLTEKCSTKFRGGNGKYISYSRENDFLEYYFKSKSDLKICSDTISNFVLMANSKTKGEVVGRISAIYPNIFIDESQDLAGEDLDLLRKMLESPSRILMVCDPRQVTYRTHQPSKNYFKDGRNKVYMNIQQYITRKKLENLCSVDEITLKQSHRNNQAICDYSFKLFPEYEKCSPCECHDCRKETGHDGIFLVKKDDVHAYCERFPDVTVLRDSKSIFPEWNFGKSKGLTFDRVLIYPTKPILEWIKNNNKSLVCKSRCKFYVALTRARYSVAIVFDFDDDSVLDGVQNWKPE